ncbi:MAG TPA: hypothetical protein VEQ11_05860, partial [Chloroflexota bacterium]|nr:hypothetical protein [Chloroflexota bacterium]
MPELKLAPLLEATHPSRIQGWLQPFVESADARPVVASTRLQPPTCYWAVYRSADRWVTLKSFFSADQY